LPRDTNRSKRPGSIAEGLARTTGYPCSLNPSTSQYLLNADSTATTWSCLRKGSSESRTNGNWFGKRLASSCLSRPSAITYSALLEGRATPQKNVLRRFGLLSLRLSDSCAAVPSAASWFPSVTLSRGWRRPPLTATGLLLGAGQWQPALGALLLTVTNIICINLAGVGTFLWQGVQPRHWWEAERAKRMTRMAGLLWVLLSAVLVVLIRVGNR
jgi:hypothetical protein